ncbi:MULTISPECIES: DNA polymerase III subunit gamma and tau [Arthrobacter]|uniref:DNA-directed DNA polymerase n=2 Tax=Arthrobacter TaxID=1663 RepID=A0ABU9KHW7_9MICC|nr:DNA polymerase III subunit gamma and tau [Arthrobacter sp. YJM1]MDP5226505.1 DNA polymerase III subunit gamma and tau [Arthrobacter sp. YJM1]
MTQASALYRRYRPDNFADVIGQEHVTVPLMTALKKNRVNHAYLFSGPRGCGKTTSARILARCLNCEQGPTDTPCGVCPSCVELARGGAGSLDVIEIDAASHGGVDDARDLRERATFAPARDRYKIFIIDEAHMVTSAGFNALLKIVEEPPEHIKFIFATTEPDKVIGTIRSRTHHYPFRLVPPEPLLAYLEQLCEQENVPVAPGVLSLVIRAGGGSVRDSLSVLDQLMAGAGPQGLDYELAVSLLGYTHASLLDDVVDAVAAQDSATVFRSVDRVLQTGHDPRRFVEDLLERFRDLIIVQAMPDSAATILRGMPQDQIARMRQQALTLGPSELSRAADVTNAALSEMSGATSPRLHLELLCARLMLPAADSGERGAAARLDALERRLALGGVPQASAPAATAPAPQQAPPRQAPVQQASPHQTPPQQTYAQQERMQQESVQQERAQPERAQEAPVPTQTVPAQTAATAAAAAARPAPEPAPAREAAAQRTPVQETPARETERPSAPQPQGGGDVEALRRAWPQVLDRLAKIKRSSWALVAPNATVARIEGDLVLLSFTTAGLAGAFGRGDHKVHLQAAVKDVLGMDCRVDAVAGDAAAPPPTFQPSAPRAEDPAPRPAERAPAAEPAPPVEEPPGWGDSPKAEAARDTTPPAGGAQRQDQAPRDQASRDEARQASRENFHPLDEPRDEDAPPLEEEPPYEDGPADWGSPAPAPAARNATVTRTAEAAPSGPASSARPSAARSSAAPAPAPTTDDPWSRAREQSPGRWTVGTESNVSAGFSAGAGQSVSEPEEPEEQSPARPPEEPAAAVSTAPEAAPPASAPPASAPPSSSPEPERAQGQSMYQRLSNSPQAQRGREQGTQAGPRTGAAGYDEISADDETIEESTTFGRKAVERLLGGTLIEETTLDGQPIIRR